jgi:hypothetical protein
MYNLTQCGGLHGHIKVAPDGTIYVPNRSCGGGQGVIVSEDNGLTFAVRIVPEALLATLIRRSASMQMGRSTSLSLMAMDIRK